MAVRKYLFWKSEDGIRTYKVTKGNTYELLHPLGRDIFPEKNLTDFFSWFHKSAAITEDEYIDFCFLSDEEIESPLLEYSSSSKSSWDKKEISMFCEKYISTNTCEVIYEKSKSFICQIGNVLDKRNVKKIFLKCIPEFSIDTEEKIDEGSEETSLVNRFFIEKLKELCSN